MNFDRDKKGRFVKGHTINNGRTISDVHKERLSRVFTGTKRPKEVIIKIIDNIPSGRKHWNWKGGITPLREKIWHSKEYKDWREKVFRRDKYFCKICGKRSGVIHADHFPLRFSKILREFNLKTVTDARNCKKLWNIDNGRTLCLSCHRKTPSWGGRKT